MKIFSNSQTGEIIGTVDGFDDHLTSGVLIIPQGLDPEDVTTHVIGLGDEQEDLARQLMDATNPLNINHLKVEDGQVVEKTIEEKAEVDSIINETAQNTKALLAEQKDTPSVQDQLDEIKSKVADLETKTDSIVQNS